MIVIETGNRYLLESFIDRNNTQEVIFIKKKIVNKEKALELLKNNPNAEDILKTSKIGVDTYALTLNDGTTNEELIDVLVHRLSYLQSESPCEQNKQAITKLKEAKHWLLERIYNKKQK